jgi:dihydroorotate dehydrogenase electron transfer subunit
MGYYRGRVTEIRHEAGRFTEANIACLAGAVPLAGQYALATELSDPEEVLGIPLFTAEQSKQGFWAAAPTPTEWNPGTDLELVGPLGHGFDLPHNIQRLGLVALGETVSRLMPLVRQMAQSHCGMTLFTDLPLPRIPDALEAYPLASLGEALDWPDFIAFDLPMERLSDLRDMLGLSERDGLPCPAQVLVTTPMLCAGMAQCGVCAVPARRGWKLACEDGPVFDLKMLIMVSYERNGFPDISRT